MSLLHGWSRYVWGLSPVVVVLALLSGQAWSNDSEDLLDIPGPLEFGGQSFHLTWSSHPSAHFYKHEYLPEGQTLERYRQMLLIDVVEGDIDVSQSLNAQMTMLENRRAHDPMVNMAATPIDERGEAILDFILSAHDEEGELIVEWNAYRYIPHQAADGSKGVLLYAISRRGYGNHEPTAMLLDLKTRRPIMIEELKAKSMPTARPHSG